MLVGFCRVVISLWIHQLLLQRQVSCWSGVHTVPTVGQRQREAIGEKEEEEEEQEGGTLQLQHKHQHLLWVQLLGGPRRAIFQFSSDRLTTSTAEVFHSQTEAGC